MKLIACFVRFVSKDDITGVTQLKASVQRGIRAKIVDHYPPLQDHINTICPKKENIVLVKCHDHIEIISVKSELLFFRQRDGPWIPTLRLLHKYPFMLPHEQVDKGAIKFILSGANIMCPGLTSPGAKLNPIEADKIVVSFFDSVACIVNKISQNVTVEFLYEDLGYNGRRLAKNKGIGIDTVHYLNDGLWVMKHLDR
eukprot:gene8445-9347_t